MDEISVWVSIYTADKPAPPRTKLSNQCKQCCCLAHHKLNDHKSKKGGAKPSLACDLEAFKLTYVDCEVNLKGPEQFESLSQMIWSCELSIKM